MAGSWRSGPAPGRSSSTMRPPGARNARSTCPAPASRMPSTPTPPPAGELPSPCPAAGRLMAMAENPRDAVLVDPKTARIVRRIPLPVPASGAGVSRDGRAVAVGDAKGEVFIDDLTTGKVLRANRTHAGSVGNL